MTNSKPFFAGKHIEEIWQRYQPSDGPPEILFHYTDAFALRSIVEASEIWATHYEYTNDALELKYGMNVAADQIERRLARYRRSNKSFTREEYVKDPSIVDKPSWVILDVVVSMVRNWPEIRLLFAEFFVSCFSANPDMLSQWRAYAANASGYSIGFDSNSLSQIGVSGNKIDFMIDLIKVIYNPEIQAEVIDKALDWVCDYVDKNIFEVQQERLEDAITNWCALLLGTVVGLSIRFKHPGFEEEDEWRLIIAPDVLDGLDLDTSIVETRVSNNRIVPFLKLAIEQSAIKNLTVGPKNNIAMMDPANDIALRQLFRNAGKDIPRVIRSRTPFR